MNLYTIEVNSNIILSKDCGREFLLGLDALLVDRGTKDKRAISKPDCTDAAI
jgi:hypothetical protein